MGNSSPDELKFLHVNDIGPSGALVSAGRPFELGQKIEIELKPLLQTGGSDQNEGGWVSSTVVRKATEPPDTYGVRFDSFQLNQRSYLHLLEALRRLKANPSD